MYLKRAYVENSGSLRKLDLKLSFEDDGRPKPIIMVGGNGSGKTNFLSLIADALFESAAHHYENVLPSKGMGRSWFRMVGGRTISVGALGSVSLLQFDHKGSALFFKEKAGSIPPAEVASRAPNPFKSLCNWEQDGPVKEIAMPEKQSEEIFDNGVYVYFPSSRSETPYWLNVEALPTIEFEVGPKFSKRLQKPIYVEHALNEFAQWLIAVLADARTEIWATGDPINSQWNFRGNPIHAMQAAPLLEQCNLLIRSILGDPEVRFVWLNRKSPDKLAVAKGDQIILPNLSALSAGQSILLGMFGTLLRYGDLSENGPVLALDQIEGICLIDGQLYT